MSFINCCYPTSRQYTNIQSPESHLSGRWDYNGRTRYCSWIRDLCASAACKVMCILNVAGAGTSIYFGAQENWGVMGFCIGTTALIDCCAACCAASTSSEDADGAIVSSEDVCCCIDLCNDL